MFLTGGRLITATVDGLRHKPFLTWQAHGASLILESIMANHEILKVLSDPSTTHWTRHALTEAMKRDPIDALHDAQLIARLLLDRADAALRSDIERMREEGNR